MTVHCTGEWREEKKLDMTYCKKERKQKNTLKTHKKHKGERKKNKESQKLKDIVEIFEGQRYNRKASGRKRKKK
jgi:hypothetical protein